jgi:hypothetical protein
MRKKEGTLLDNDMVRGRGREGRHKGGAEKGRFRT